MNRLIYFSATQNTYNLTISLRDMLKADNYMVSDINTHLCFDKNDFTVFLCPVYNANIASVMKKFINSLDGAESKALVICTYGNVFEGGALQNTIILLQKQGYNVTGGVSVPMPHSYNGECLSVGSFPDINIIENIAQFITDSDKESLIYSVQRTFTLRKTLSAFLSQKLIGKMTCIIIKDCEKCINCAKCKKICPVSAISDAMTVNHKKCIRCSACVKECRANALSVKFLTKLPINYIKHYGKKTHKVSYYLVDNKRLNKIIF